MHKSLNARTTYYFESDHCSLKNPEFHFFKMKLDRIVANPLNTNINLAKKQTLASQLYSIIKQ